MMAWNTLLNATGLGDDMSYSVGKNDDGSTVLTMGTDFKSTLTMNQVAVLQMIKLLAATLNSFTVDINRIKE